MQVTPEPFITLCCCPEWSYCTPQGLTETKLLIAGYRKIENTEPANNLSVSQHSLNMNPMKKKIVI